MFDILQSFFYLLRRFYFISNARKSILNKLHLISQPPDFSFAANLFLWNFYNRLETKKDLSQ